MGMAEYRSGHHRTDDDSVGSVGGFITFAEASRFTEDIIEECDEVDHAWVTVVRDNGKTFVLERWIRSKDEIQRSRSYPGG